MNKIKPNTKIKILSPEHLDYVKKVAYESGFDWGNVASASCNDFTHLFFRESMLIAYLDDGDNAYFHNSESTKDMTEIFIPLPNTNPVPPFKIRNANHPAVRQWLKDMGCTYKAGYDILTWNKGHKFGYVNEHGHFTTSVITQQDEELVCDYFINFFENHSYPELTLNLAVTSWSLPEPVNPAKQEKIEHIKAIEVELAKLKAMDS